MLRISRLVMASSVLTLVFADRALADVVLCSEAAGGGAAATAGLSAAQVAALQNNTGGGCVAKVDAPSIYVASDAEVAFDPFGFGADTSDGIIVPANYVFMGGNGWSRLNAPPAAITAAFPNSQIWVLPANLTGIGCGSENEPTCEPIITFQNPLPFGSDTTLGTYIINQAGGSPESDRVVLDNVGGKGIVTFQSDPVPEPSYVLLLGTALVGVLWFSRRRLLSSKRSS